MAWSSFCVSRWVPQHRIPSPHHFVPNCLLLFWSCCWAGEIGFVHIFRCANIISVEFWRQRSCDESANGGVRARGLNPQQNDHPEISHIGPSPGVNPSLQHHSIYKRNYPAPANESSAFFKQVSSFGATEGVDSLRSLSSCSSFLAQCFLILS